MSKVKSKSLITKRSGSTIDGKKVEKIKKMISEEFPEFKGVEPKIIEKLIPPQSSVYKKLSLGVPKGFTKVFSLKFKRIVETTDAVKIERILFVTISEEGEIIKITESR